MIENCNQLNKISQFSFHEDALIQLILYKFLSEDRHNDIRIEQEYSFENLINISNNGDMSLEILEEAFLSFEIMIETESLNLFKNIFTISSFKNITNQVLKSMIITIASIDLNHIDTASLFNYLASCNGHRSKFSSMITPECINELISNLLSKEYDKVSVADQSCGCGSLAFKLNDKILVNQYYLQDINNDAIRYSKINAIMNNISIDKISINQGDVITDDKYINLKFDIQVTNPPFAYMCFQDESLLNDERFKSYGDYPPKNLSDFLFLENAIYHMSNNGVVVFICTDHLLNSENRNEKIRKAILDLNYLDTIIRIPENCLISTAIPFNILILKKQKKSKNIFYIDTTNYFSGKKIKEIDSNGINTITQIYLDRKDIDGISANVGLDEIASNKYKLSVNKYIEKRKIKKLLSHEKLIQLKNVANVIKPKNIDGTAKIANRKALTYPISYENLEDGQMSTVKLQKGDIVISSSIINNCYLVNETPNIEIYAKPNDLVIRPTTIQSEYLLIFLKSDIGRRIMEIESGSSFIKTINSERLSNIRIPLPKESEGKYKQIFELENHLKISYSSFTELLKNKHKYMEDNIQDIFEKELLSNVKLCKQDAMKTFLNEDINELNLCFRAKAYKATLVLAGSILEAVLIDWLSEIHGVDYFENEYYVIDKRTGKNRRADLFDYIDEIKIIEYPDWTIEAGKAHEIRKKRNLVHAKLGIASKDINETTCRKVISYLKDVIKTRGFI